jgi:hypothetical protein
MVIITRFKESRSAGFQHNLDKASAFVREEVLSDGAINTDSPFGRLRSPPQHIDGDVSLNQPYTMVAEGDNLSGQWADGPLTLLEAYQQYRQRLDTNQPQVSAGAEPDGSDFSGGLPGRLIALMRQYPEKFGPPPRDG